MMISTSNFEMIVIGGSAGSLPVVFDLIKALPQGFKIPIVIVIHRQRSGFSEMTTILTTSTGYNKIKEPDDKENILDSYIYIAPQNYHLLIENDRTFSLDYSEAILFSRPSIDVTFESAARVFKDKLIAILLSGANSDGTFGIEKVVEFNGVGIVQEPGSAQYAAMPQSALSKVKGLKSLKPSDISELIKKL